MGRRRKAWLRCGTGRRIDRGRLLPGYQVQWTEPHSHRQRSQTFGTLRAARAFIRSINEEFDRLAMGPRAPQTLETAGTEMLEYIGARAPTTRADYAKTITYLCEYLGKQTAVVHVTGADVDAWLGWLRRLPGRPGTLSESSVARHYRNARRLFRWCRKREYLDRVPTGDVTVVPQTAVRELPAIPTEKQIAKLVSKIGDESLKVATLLALTIGWDRGVIARLAPRDFDLKAGLVRYRRPKTRRLLVAPIPSGLVPAIRRVCARTQSDQAVFAAYWRVRWYREAQQAAGEPWLSLRIADFRKVASQRLQRVLPLAQVQRILGHSTPQTTSRHYTTLDPAVQRAVEQLPLPLSAPKPQRPRRKPA